MARDAIARQSDVDSNSVVLHRDTDKGRYQPGTIAFAAKAGQSINLNKIRDSIAATRLSGYTNMRVDYLDIVVRGQITFRNKEMVLQVSGTQQEMVLAADDRELEKRMHGLAAKNETVTLKGRVDGWNGRFPVVLKVLAERYGGDTRPMFLVVTSIETPKK